jgi:hypothetical protein
MLTSCSATTAKAGEFLSCRIANVTSLPSSLSQFVMQELWTCEQLRKWRISGRLTGGRNKA